MKMKIVPEEICIRKLYTLSATAAAAYLEGFCYPWEAIAGIAGWIQNCQKRLPRDEYEEILPGVLIARDARIAPEAVLLAPTLIGHETEIRPGAYVRGAVLVGNGCVVGNSTELKNCILFDGVQVPHYNYVGDSILGQGAHMGAGAITSNVKGDRTQVAVLCGEQRLETGRKKCGAFLADGVEIGCGAVLNPGTVIGRNSRVYPLVSVRGCIPAGHLVKGMDRIERISD